MGALMAFVNESYLESFEIIFMENIKICKKKSSHPLTFS